MEAYFVEWLNLLVRWLHFITGVAWIGASFYFIWLDNHLEAPRDPDDKAKGVDGEVWSVHGGGLYHAQKYETSPKVLPETLHWFKWEAYSTWLSGMFLLILLYWYGAEVYLIDPTVAALSPMTAIAIAAGSIAGGWIVYDLMCKSPLGKHDSLFAAVLFAAVSLLAWGLCQVFSGRGAFMHFGAILGTIMVANVFFVIIPGQKQMVASAARGEQADPVHGFRGKQRSVHNTYFTLPVLFIMISNHYPMTYSDEQGWLVLGFVMMAGVLIRQFFVLRHSGKQSWVLPAIGVALLLVMLFYLMPPVIEVDESVSISDSQMQEVIKARCTSCHARKPTQAGFAEAPLGLVLETQDQTRTNAANIARVIATRYMPIGNLTQMTDAERELVATWYALLSPTQ
jgi:uncharacterized membrane protein